jgi:arginine repressor
MRYFRTWVVVAGIYLGFALRIPVCMSSPIPPIIRTGHHTLVGELVRIDKKAKKLVIRTADGVEHVVLYTGRTTVHSLERVGNASYLAGKEGSQVVVHYTQHGATATADEVDVFGHQVLQATDGTLVKVDKDGRHVVIRTKDGAEETYDLGRDAALDTADGVADASDLVAKEGDHVVVYHTKEGGRKVLHILKDLGHEF